jgi:hypothetical protein
LSKMKNRIDNLSRKKIPSVRQLDRERKSS